VIFDLLFQQKIRYGQENFFLTCFRPENRSEKYDKEEKGEEGEESFS